LAVAPAVEQLADGGAPRLLECWVSARPQRSGWAVAEARPRRRAGGTAVDCGAPGKHAGEAAAGSEKDAGGRAMGAWMAEETRREGERGKVGR
jgi:hypothetical protein